MPSNYYDAAAGKSGPELKSALAGIISNHTVKTYGDARTILQILDADPGNTSNVLLVYSGYSVIGAWDAGITWKDSYEKAFHYQVSIRLKLLNSIKSHTHSTT